MRAGLDDLDVDWNSCARYVVHEAYLALERAKEFQLICLRLPAIKGGAL
jgi:hypothetical protein